MKRCILFLLFVTSLGFSEEPPLRLQFGIYPSDRTTIMYRMFAPILDALRAPIENQLHREVDIHMTLFEDYESGIKALTKGEVDFVRFEPSSYIVAEELNPNIQLLAMELQKGVKRFNGLIIAHKDANIAELSDLNGKTFAFGDENSAVGRFLSQSLLVDNNITSVSLASFDFLGRHDLVAQAVMTKSHDAGVVKSSTYKNVCDPEEVIIVRAFSNVTKPWIARSDLSKDVCEAITAALFLLEDQKVIGQLGCSGFTEANSEEYDLVREGMKNAAAFYPKPEEDGEEEEN